MLINKKKHTLCAKDSNIETSHAYFGKDNYYKINNCTENKVLTAPWSQPPFFYMMGAASHLIVSHHFLNQSLNFLYPYQTPLHAIT